MRQVWYIKKAWSVTSISNEGIGEISILMNVSLHGAVYYVEEQSDNKVAIRRWMWKGLKMIKVSDPVSERYPQKCFSCQQRFHNAFEQVNRIQTDWNQKYLNMNENQRQQWGMESGWIDALAPWLCKFYFIISSNVRLVWRNREWYK